MFKKSRAGTAIVFCALAASTVISATSASGAVGLTTRVSVASDGAQANNTSVEPEISANGRFVAFISSASNLVPNDTNTRDDVFLRDRVTGTTTRVNVTSAGAQATGALLGDIALSADGGHVAFLTNAPLVPGDNNATFDAFVHDVSSGITERVSVSTNEAQANSAARGISISADGRHVAFVSSSGALVSSGLRVELFVRDRVSGTTRNASAPLGTPVTSGSSNFPAISADGRYVAFSSSALDLVPNDTNGHESDIFVRDLVDGSIRLVSVSSDGVQPTTGSTNRPSISADARYVTFRSTASTLVPGDNNGDGDVFLRDTQAGTTTRVSVGNGTSGVAGLEFEPAPVSGNGRYVAFASGKMLAPSGASGSFDVYVRDIVAATTTRVSLTGTQPSFSSQPAISADGRYVAFMSHSPNLVTADTNGRPDIFVHDRVVDDTAPQVTPVPTPNTPDGTNGWYRTDVSLDWLVTDAESPTENVGCLSVTVTEDQPKTSYECTASSAGGTTGPVSVVIGRDATPPTAEAGVLPAAPDGLADWYVTSPTVSYTCSDATSGVDLCPSPTPVGEGTNHQPSGIATDLAGNVTTASAGLLNVDLTDPELECTNSANLSLNQVAQVTALVHDGISGPTTPTVSAAADTSTVGPHETTLTAHDVAGRSGTRTCSYNVAYEFSGFLAPVNTQAVNVAKSGSTVPLKWRITDHGGVPVTDVSSARVTTTAVPCDLGTSEDLIEEIAAGDSGLQNNGDGFYQFNWKIPQTYEGSCKTLHLDLGEGATRTVEFRIGK